MSIHKLNILSSKIYIRVLALLLTLCLLVGCGASSAQPDTGADNSADNNAVASAQPENTAADREPIHIVTTIFPIYDWLREITNNNLNNNINNNNIELTLLLDTGMDLHSYQPSVDDMVTIANADLFIYVGGESDTWVEDALHDAHDGVGLSLLEILGDAVVEEETVEGMEHEHDEHDEHEHEDEIELDEHVWLSLRNAQVLCTAICDALTELDPTHAQDYRANLQAYTQALAALDTEYAQMVDAATMHTVLFGDRFPFRYLVDDYGLDYYAAFSGCSAETEASFETIVFLSQKLEELGLPYVLTCENSDGKLARAIIDNSGQAADSIAMDSLQTTTRAEIDGGKTYLGTMTANLDVLRLALSS